MRTKYIGAKLRTMSGRKSYRKASKNIALLDQAERYCDFNPMRWMSKHVQKGVIWFFQLKSQPSLAKQISGSGQAIKNIYMAPMQYFSQNLHMYMQIISIPQSGEANKYKTAA